MHFERFKSAFFLQCSGTYIVWHEWGDFFPLQKSLLRILYEGEDRRPLARPAREDDRKMPINLVI